MKEWEWTWTKDGTEYLITVRREGDSYFSVWADNVRVISVRANRGSPLSRIFFGTDELVPLFGSELRLTVGRLIYGLHGEQKADLFENGRSLRDGSTLAERREKLRAAAGKSAIILWIVAALFLFLRICLRVKAPYTPLYFSMGTNTFFATVCALFTTKAAKIKDLLPDDELQ